MNEGSLNEDGFNDASLTRGSQVRIVEVGPRDGLQNESVSVSVEDRVNLVNRLSAAGFSTIETGSFVSERWIPQMASSDAVFRSIDRKTGVRYAALAPNLHGLEAAIAAGVDEIAVFASASESFSQRNINCSIEESFERFRPMMAVARDNGLPVRGYVSCSVDCPYEGTIAPEAALRVSEILIELGCYEIALSDTTGKGTPASINQMLEAVIPVISADKLALHCHDTYGQGIVNIHAALNQGVRVFDSSVAGLGGCPYARGASGNIATEDLLYLLEGLGMDTGINLDATIDTGNFITEILGCPNRSKVAQAMREP